MKKIGKADIIVWGIVLGILFVLLLAYRLTAENGAYVQVRVAGSIQGQYTLGKDGTYEIAGKEQGKNLLVIKNGEAYIKEANCPDKLCVKQGRVRKVGESLICLPNEVVVEVIRDAVKDDAVDAVVK